MATPSVPPLRIQKGPNGSSPNKMPLATNRPLTELSPMAIRRNSPSFPQGKGKLFSNESSPAGSSPFSNNAASPRLFWQGREQSPARENRNPHELLPSPGPAKRSSIENLKKASRVKNSGMFALEQTKNYDPSRPSILDGRPLNNSRSSGLRDSDLLSYETTLPAEPQNDEEADISELEDYPSATDIAPLSPSKLNTSPTKSSLSKKTASNFRHSAFDPVSGIWEDDDDDIQAKRLPEGKSLHRYAKSVTFDQAPPQVNEYEMTTPDPSSVASGSREGSYESMDDEEEVGFGRGESIDHDDSFDASLEDTDKTPVVMPEDWRFMSPDVANTELARHEEDVFDDEYGSPAPTANPGPLPYRPHQTSVNSVDSNGQPRPLPPLPAGLSPPAMPAAHRDSLSGTLERMSGQRNLPSPPFAAGVSKSDIRRMSGGNFSMDDRLRLIMAEKEQQQQNSVDAQRERRMRRAGSKDPSPVRGSSHESNTPTFDEPGPAIDESNAPRISRESIMRHMRSNQDLQGRVGSEESEARSQPSVYDPDVAIPSREDPTQTFEDSIVVKEEEVEDSDISSIPDYYAHQSDLESNADDDLTSQYSQPSISSLPVAMDDGQETPRANSPVRETKKKHLANDRMSLPDFMDFGQESSFDLGLQTYMTPPTEAQPEQEKRPTPPPKNDVMPLPDLAALRNSIRPYTPTEQLQPPQAAWESDEPGTPDSVIRHPTHTSLTPEISEPEALSKAFGAKLNIRSPSSQSQADSLQNDVDISPQPDPTTEKQSLDLPQPKDSTPPSDGLLKAELEKKPRVSSLVQLQIPQEQTSEGLGFGLEKEFDRVVEAQKVEFERSLKRLYYPFNGRFPSSELPDPKDSSVHLMHDIPSLPRPRGARPLPEESNAHPPENYANRGVRRQRGYLMRQNTKVVVASERASHDETRVPELPPPGEAAVQAPANEVVASSRKASQPTWTAEPWNGKKRRKSIRVGGEASPQKPKQTGPAPPLPGLPSAVQEGLGAVEEDELAEEEAEEFEDGAERGRLFVKVIGVKDLQLPFPKDERTSFALTLDNGMHCVTTAWLDLAKDAPIGQEFELVVLNDLEFQLTLQMKLEEPKQQRPTSPSKPPASPKKSGAFGRFFGSPKKRKEDSKIHEIKRPVTPPSFYELVQGLVAKDGSFARAYISLNEHEKKSYGRPHSVDIKCFNEWAMEEVHAGSSRSKKSVTQLQRRPPYEIGKLELLLLYVPKPKGAKDEDMPKSMNSAVRALREAEEKVQQTASIKSFEGHLSQQGGDCPYWRRRFFRLVGSKLTAYHEATLQPRATINLAKATKLIDDKSALTKKETSTKGGGRRKSAFAEEEEGYMFVEEGFRMRFANGEVIDFYADTTAQKEEWMKVLSQVVGKAVASPGEPVKGWTEMVLKREKSTLAKKPVKAEVPPRGSSREMAGMPVPELKPTQERFGNSGIPLPTRPAPSPNARPGAGHLRSESYQPEGGSRSVANSPVKARVGREERHKKAKSLIM